MRLSTATAVAVDVNVAKNYFDWIINTQSLRSCAGSYRQFDGIQKKALIWTMSSEYMIFNTQPQTTISRETPHLRIINWGSWID